MRRALGLAAALAGGCVAAPEETGEAPRAIAGEHVTLYVTPGREACGDLVAHMDAFTEAVAAALAVDLEGLQFAFYWDTEESYADGPCPSSALGCATEDGVHSRAAPHDHELVHSVSFEIGYPTSFFVEGLAVAFETPSVLEFAVLELPGDGAVADTMLAPKLGYEDYRLAGAFTRFVIDRHGLAAYREFYAGLYRDPGLAPVEASFEATFGEPLADAIAAFDAGRRTCPAGVSAFQLLECGAPPIAWDGERLEVRRSLRCGDEGVIGPYNDGTARSIAAFEVAEAGGYVITFAAEWSGAMVALTSCGGCDGEWVAEVLIAEDGPRELLLPAGRYALQFAGRAGERTGMGLRLQRAAP